MKNSNTHFATWRIHAGRIIVMPVITHADRGRETMALVVFALACVFAAVAFFRPAAISINLPPGIILNLALAALILAGLLHCWLVFTGIHEPIARFSSLIFYINRQKCPTSQIAAIRVERTNPDSQAALVLILRTTTTPPIVAIPSGLFPEAELENLAVQIQQLIYRP